MDLDIGVIIASVITGSFMFILFIARDMILERKNRDSIIGERDSKRDLNEADEERSESDAIENLRKSIDGMSSNYGMLNQKYVDAIKETSDLRQELSGALERIATLERFNAKREEAMVKLIEELDDHKYGTSVLTEQILEFPAIPRWRPKNIKK